MRKAIMGLDPGQTTGFCFMLLDTSKPHPIRRMTVSQHAARTTPTDASWMDQYLREAVYIDKVIDRFIKRARDLGVLTEDRHLVVEDFILRPMADSGRHTLSPVYISSALYALRPPIDWTWQQPSSQTDRVIPKAGMVQANIWTPGHDHAVSATRHAVVKARHLGISGCLSERNGPPLPFLGKAK